MPMDCPTIVIGNFNIDVLTKMPQSTTFHNLMNKYNFKPTFSKCTTINNTQINHIRINALAQQCHSRAMQEYCTKHKPIYKLSSNGHSASLKSFYHKQYVYMTNIYYISNTLIQKLFKEIFSIP